ncbi:DUF2971 domain-containing protein [Haploplasma modicum]|uniref:DUF2971 domain-containing protein n=1 Tax=Haploplasma modicum TaxID=2150 RepID=UPI00047B6FB3|nr:DUF2971 domain-containing protein [Haploplasma modicum]
MASNMKIDKILDLKGSNDKKKQILAKLKDSDFKLYRYCSFDDEHNPYNNDGFNYDFKNLINHVIYSSKPSQFNDPFDCTIGYSTETLLNDIIKSFFNLDYFTNLNRKNDIKRIFKDTSNRDKKLVEASLWEPSLIRDIVIQMIKIDDIYYGLHQKDKFFPKNNGYWNKEISKLIFSHEDFRESFLDNFLDQKYRNENTRKQLLDVFTNPDFPLDKLLAQPNLVVKDSKYALSSVNFSFDNIDLIKSIDSKEKEEIMTTIEQLNEIANRELKKLSNLIDKHIGITCFSKRDNIPLMWSHYSNKHRGFVVEYDFINISDEDIDIMSGLFVVKYSKDRVRLLPSDIQKFKDDIESRTKVLINNIIEALYTKSKEWGYESEVRNIVYIQDDNRIISFKYVKSIILGVNASENLQSLMLNLCRKENWSLYRYKLHKDEYKLEKYQML